MTMKQDSCPKALRSLPPAGDRACIGCSSPKAGAHAHVRTHSWQEGLAYAEKPLLCWAQVLVRLHADVLPHLVDSLLLTDFLTHALDGGGLNGAPLALFCALHYLFLELYWLCCC